MEHQGPESGDIQHLVEKVVFHLNESYPKRKRGMTEGSFLNMHTTINIYARSRCTKWWSWALVAFSCVLNFTSRTRSSRKSVFQIRPLNPEGKPPVDHLRFNNSTKEFRRKLIKAGGVMVVPEGTEAVSRSSPDSSMPPTKKIKTSHLSEESRKGGSGGSSSQADQ